MGNQRRSSSEVTSIFDIVQNVEYIQRKSIPLPSGCRMWVGGLNGGGVAQMHLQDENGNSITRTVRQVFMAGHTGIDPHGSGNHVASPNCGNRNCVNPDHLSITFVDGTDGTEKSEFPPFKSKIVKKIAEENGLDIVNVKLVPVDPNGLKGFPTVKRGRGRPKGSVNKTPKPVKWW